MPAFEFQQPFDGSQPQVTAAEQETVKAVLSGVIGDVLLNNMAHATVSPLNLALGRQGDSDFVHLEEPAEYPDTDITVSRELQPDGSVKRLWVVLNRANGQTSEYMTDPTTGNIVRFDTEKLPQGYESPKLDDEKMIEIHGDPDAPEEDEYTEQVRLSKNLDALRAQLWSESANDDIDQMTGRNGQPVGLAEIERVGDLLTTGKPQ